MVAFSSSCDVTSPLLWIYHMENIDALPPSAGRLGSGHRRLPTPNAQKMHLLDVILLSHYNKIQLKKKEYFIKSGCFTLLFCILS